MAAQSSQQSESRITDDPWSDIPGIAAPINGDAIVGPERIGGYTGAPTSADLDTYELAHCELTARLTRVAEQLGAVAAASLRLRECRSNHELQVLMHEIETLRSRVDTELVRWFPDLQTAIRLATEADAELDSELGQTERTGLGTRPVPFARCRADACGYDLDEHVAEQVCREIL